jgi:ABC-type Fe3+-citrate transport system substrate-binding protein
MQTDALNLFGGFAGIGVLMAGLGFGWSQFKSGAGKAKDDLIKTLQESIDAEKAVADRLNKEKNEILTSHQTQINQLTEKIGKLTGLYEASEARNKEYVAILQGRSPEQTKFMEFMVNAAKESAKTTSVATKYMQDTTEILGEIKSFMAIIGGELAKGNISMTKLEKQVKKANE